MQKSGKTRATKKWVIFSPARSKRPHEFGQKRAHATRHPVYDESCPFCPGNEDQIPPIILEIHGAKPEQWETRVVPNKFPVLISDQEAERIGQGFYQERPGYGHHEVIIESPDHSQDISSMSVEHVRTVLETYRSRYSALMESERISTVIIFRNHGPCAGTSIFHPHSQLIASEIVPIYIRNRQTQAENYFREYGRCVYCDILETEIEQQQRVILENDSFLGFVPFAAEVPFEIWLVPRVHRASFGHVSEQEEADLAAALSDVLGRLRGKLGDPDYNYVIHTSTKDRSTTNYLHWYLQIRPRTITPAGFEIGSGVPINPSKPEDDAAMLREQ